MKLWHDDVRLPPRGWVWATNNEAAKAALETDSVTEISLDHDLGGTPGDHYLVRGTAEENGFDLAVWMVNCGYLPTKINVHSMSVSGGDHIMGVFETLLRAQPWIDCELTRVVYDLEWAKP